jgi:hypothetical protein
MATSPGRAWRTRRSSGSITLVEVLMLVAMGRHVASEPCGRGKNSGRFHPFRSSFFQSLSIKNMYDVCRVGVVRYVVVNECPRKEWRGGREKMKDKEQSSKGSVDNLKTLKNRKEKEREGDTGRAGIK